MAVYAERRCRRGCALFRWGIGGAFEQVGFEERDAVEAPSGVGESLDKLGICGGGWFVFVMELLAVLLVGGGVFGGQDGKAAGETVLQRILGGAGFALGGAGSGGVEGVEAILDGAGLVAAGVAEGVHDGLLGACGLVLSIWS